MNKNILICGVGGQGTVLASKIIAASAMIEGSAVHSAETIGMAQRGGSVTSHVRIGEAYSPLIPYGTADMILAFEPAEAVRNLIYLKKGGYDGTAMLEYLKSKCGCVVIDAKKICEPFGSSRYFNIAILGVAVGTGRLGISKETILKEIEKRVPSKFVETNKAAFFAGYGEGEKYETE